MKKAKAKPGNVTPRGITHFKGETKLDKLNKQALKYIRAIKGSFG
ncbi:hypothetical protein [Sutcliffiella horikoshii]|nr:hypothetical protein [Sutcliffiella horikoshii]